MVVIDTIWGSYSFKSYVEARKFAYSELTGAYQSAYGQIPLYINQHTNKSKEIMEYDQKSKRVITHRVENNTIAVYEVKRNGELGAKLSR